MSLKNWNELPLLVKRNPKKFFDYLSEELGLDAKLARRAGLLHDIGKALDHDMEGTHVEIGVEILKKYKG